MRNLKISGPVVAIIVIIAIVVVVMMGNHIVNPPQSLNAQAQSMADSLARGRASGGPSK